MRWWSHFAQRAERLAASLHIEFPMLFEISNLREGRHSHCGVLEFVAEEGVVYLPYWARRRFASCFVRPHAAFGR